MSSKLHRLAGMSPRRVQTSTWGGGCGKGAPQTSPAQHGWLAGRSGVGQAAPEGRELVRGHTSGKNFHLQIILQLALEGDGTVSEAGLAGFYSEACQLQLVGLRYVK